MTETTRPSLKVAAPAPVTKYATGDGKIHDTELDAIAHEIFLAVKGDLHINDQRLRGVTTEALAYGVVVTLAKKYEFVPRSAA